ncbi:MAG: cytochrome c3 family protein [Chloroflexi bacterium]|nr:cytochrome c3 family protein [Chloroflexota bacterium]
MGEHLKSIHSVGEEGEGGVFDDYRHVIFPKDVRNCTACHVDDRWKTQPSQLACGTCHDSIWFGDVASMPKGDTAHPGGPQTNDSGCNTCHQPDTKSVAPSITEAHKVEIAYQHKVELAITAPANGKFFVAGEKPKLTITIKDVKTGAAINPSTIVEPKVSTNVSANEWRGARLFVSGPRVQTKPVLTTAAALPADKKTYTYAANDLRVRQVATNEDAAVTRSATAITYQLGDVKDLRAGTYTVFFYAQPATGLGGNALINFQVGTETPDKMVATNCAQCHGDTVMHGTSIAGPFALAPDLCKSCHDYERQLPGNVGWTTRNNGFGAAPIARRVHGVHFGHYTDKPKEIHAREDYSGVIFPQDVRNCTKCHDAAGSNRWKEEPSRVACLACHDKDSAIAHGTLMTQDATPAEPYSGDEIETCRTCHGAGRDFSPDKVHNISNPYKPPYPRSPAE